MRKAQPRYIQRDVYISRARLEELDAAIAAYAADQATPDALEKRERRDLRKMVLESKCSEGLAGNITGDDK